MFNFLLMTLKNKIFLTVWAILLVVFILYFILRHYNFRRRTKFEIFYKYVFDRYGKKYVGDYESALVVKGTENRALTRYEYVEMKFQDENGVERTCKTLNELVFVETPELKWIKRQRNGVEMKVFKDFAYFEIPEIDVSCVNLAKGYGFKEFLLDILKGCLYFKPMRKEFKEYYSEFKKSEEYYNFKHPKKKDKRREYI